MRKKYLPVMALCLLLLPALIGCGDDDCPACPDPVTPLGHARGRLILNPGAYLVPMHVYSYGMVAPNLDSVKVGDSLVSREFWSMSTESPFADAHWHIPFVEMGDTSTFMYDHGDMATIEAWGEGRSGICQLKILNPALAAASVTEPLAYVDTIIPGASDTVFWNEVDHIDYYAVMIAWYVRSNDLEQYTFEYHYSADTSFVITGAMSPADTVLHYNVHVTPFTGPDPRTGKSNWSGTLLDGVIFSYGYESSTTIVFYAPIDLSKMSVPKSSVGLPETSSEDIVANVYKKYGN